MTARALRLHLITVAVAVGTWSAVPASAAGAVRQLPAESFAVQLSEAYAQIAGRLEPTVVRVDVTAVQNHIIQLLCLTAMESPRSLDANDIREEKVKVLKAIDKFKHPLKESIKGQYLSGKIDKSFLKIREK